MNFVPTLCVVLYSAILILGLGTITWTWDLARSEVNEELTTEWFLGCLAMSGVVLVGSSRLFDVFRLSAKSTLLKIRTEFTLTALLALAWLSTTTTLTSITIARWPSSPYLSLPPYQSEPASSSFPSSFLFLSAAFQTLFLLSAACLLSEALTTLHRFSTVGREVGWVMWDVDEPGGQQGEGTGLLGGVDRVLGSVGPPRGGRYGAVGGARNRDTDEAAVKFGLEDDLNEVGRRRVYWTKWVGAFSGAVVLGSSTWAVLGWEGFDKYDVSLWISSSMILYLVFSTLFLPSTSKPSLLNGSLLKPLLAILVILYPIPTILFTLPPESNPAGEPQTDLSPPILLSPWLIQRSIGYLPGITVGCAWGLMAVCVGWLVDESIALPKSRERDEGIDEEEGLFVNDPPAVIPFPFSVKPTWRSTYFARHRAFEMLDDESVEDERALDT